MCVFFSVVFSFKQKTAYEMRIIDWSSDVCSSDLEIRHVTRRRPGLLTTDDVVVAVANGARPHARKVGPGLRFGETLAEPQIAAQDRIEKALLQCSRAETTQDRPDHRQADQAEHWRVGDSTFDIEDVLLTRSPAGAAERDRKSTRLN